MYGAAVFALFLGQAATAAPAAPVSPAPATPREDFRRGRAAYDRGEYDRAIGVLRPLLYPSVRIESEGEVAQAHRMLGIAHLFTRENDLAAQEFRKLLQLRPDYRMDPLLDSPQVVEFFNAVVRDHEAELARLEAKRKEAERLAKARAGKASGPVVEKRYVRNSLAVAFIPFGAGQFQNGDRRKGWGFLAAESALAAVSAGAMATNLALYGLRPKQACKSEPDAPVTGGPCGPGRVVDTTNQDRSRLLLRVQLVSGALFWAVAIWGVADAVAHFAGEVPITMATATDPGRVRRPSRLVLLPMVADRTAGAGLAFRF